MPVESLLFRRAMSRLPTGVAVLVARDAAGGCIGMTASAITSLSLEPPMVLACIGREAAAHAALTRGRAFALNVLAADQEAVSRRFADRSTQQLDASGLETTPCGLPRLPGVLACLEVRRGQVFEAGDHSIVTGVVEWAWAGDGEPLVYARGGYTRLAG